MSAQFPKDCCSIRPGLRARPLLSSGESAELEALFKVLGNQTRLRMLHALARAGEVCVTDLADSLEMKPQAISNQLQRLVDRGMVAPRRNGNNIFYRIVDPCIVSLLDRGVCLIEEARERVGVEPQVSVAQSLHTEEVR
jgi:ArsR family transcriptional regulator, lead/cadmium/zinc/bismuth-responsive transcriptional repressor